MIVGTRFVDFGIEVVNLGLLIQLKHIYNHHWPLPLAVHREPVLMNVRAVFTARPEEIHDFYIFIITGPRFVFGKISFR